MTYSNLDNKKREVIIFGSPLTTFDVKSIIRVAGAEVKIGSSLKSNHYLKSMMSKSLKHAAVLLLFVKCET